MSRRRRRCARRRGGRRRTRGGTGSKESEEEYGGVGWVGEITDGELAGDRTRAVARERGWREVEDDDVADPGWPIQFI